MDLVDNDTTSPHGLHRAIRRTNRRLLRSLPEGCGCALCYTLNLFISERGNIMQEMPNKTKHTVMFVFSWLFWFVFGLISLGAYITMNKRIAAGDVEGANASAKKVRTVFWIGLIITIVSCVIIIIMSAVGAANYAY